MPKTVLYTERSSKKDSKGLTKHKFCAVFHEWSIHGLYVDEKGCCTKFNFGKNARATKIGFVALMQVYFGNKRRFVSYFQNSEFWRPSSSSETFTADVILVQPHSAWSCENNEFFGFSRACWWRGDVTGDAMWDGAGSGRRCWSKKFGSWIGSQHLRVFWKAYGEACKRLNRLPAEQKERV